MITITIVMLFRDIIAICSENRTGHTTHRVAKCRTPSSAAGVTGL
jgi:hypothetical protein